MSDDVALLQKEFDLRRSAIEYTLCTDRDIWEEIKREEEIGKKTPITSHISDTYIYIPSSANHLVNCDVDPYLEDSWRIEEHRKGGMVQLERRGEDLYANGKKIELFLSEGQKNGKYIDGRLLYKELVDKPVLNANILDYLLKTENQHLIPESWRGNYVSFWGDVYSNSGSSLFVRCVYWDYKRWCWSRSWFDRVFYPYNPSAISAS